MKLKILTVSLQNLSNLVFIGSSGTRNMTLLGGVDYARLTSACGNKLAGKCNSAHSDPNISFKTFQ